MKPNGDDRLRLLTLLARRDEALRSQFGSRTIPAHPCLLMGRHYRQSPVVYFSLNPSFARSGTSVDLTSHDEWNVPFHNPPFLLQEYSYLRHCQRFFASDAALSQWIQNGISSAFLVPWRTRTLGELDRLDAECQGEILRAAGELVATILRDHRARLLLVVGKAAPRLLERLNVVKGLERQTPFLGPGGTYQWSRWQAEFRGQSLKILQIPHFSRANSAALLTGLRDWLQQEVLYSRVMSNTGEIRNRLLARREELKTGLRRQEENALESADVDVQDEIDRVTTDEAKTSAYQLGARQSDALADVEAALARLEAGTYGICTVCGETIEDARLRALPETPYCIRDAELAEAEDSAQNAERVNQDL